MKTLAIRLINMVLLLVGSGAHAQTSDFGNLGHVVDCRLQGLTGHIHLVRFQGPPGQGQARSDSDLRVQETFAFNSASLSYPTFSLHETHDTFNLSYSYNDSPTGKIISRTNSFRVIANESRHEIQSITARSSYYSLNQSIGEEKKVTQETLFGRFPYTFVDSAGQKELRVALRSSDLRIVLDSVVDLTFSLHNFIDPREYTVKFQSGIDSLVISDSAFLELAIGGSNALVSTHSAGLVESKAQPNPFTSNLKLEFIIPKQQFVEIELRDELGKIVFRNNGNYQYESNNKSIDTSTLPIGVYYYSIRTQTSELHGKAIKLGK